jgi:hypothetical protein
MGIQNELNHDVRAQKVNNNLHQRDIQKVLGNKQKKIYFV